MVQKLEGDMRLKEGFVVVVFNGGIACLQDDYNA